MKKICFIATLPITINSFLAGHLSVLSARYEVHVATNTMGSPDCSYPGWMRIHRLAINRKIAPLSDFYVLSKLILLFRKQRYTLISSITPKCGLLSMLAGLFTRIPLRVHIFTGQVWATKNGIYRSILKLMDRITAASATHILADSKSQRDFLINERVVNPSKIEVLANGSMRGVDRDRFKPDTKARQRLRRSLGIPENDPVILFLGRLKRDKGVLDLANAFMRLKDDYPAAHLVFVGPDEEALAPKISTITSSVHECIHIDSYTNTPEHYMAAADVFALPSYREGFGAVIIEAASTGLPAVASRIYGLTDAVVDGNTGILHTPGNIDEIESAMRILLSDNNIRKNMGDAARRRAHKYYDSEYVSKSFEKFYERILEDTNQVLT